MYSINAGLNFHLEFLARLQATSSKQAVEARETDTDKFAHGSNVPIRKRLHHLLHKGKGILPPFCTNILALHHTFIPLPVQLHHHIIWSHSPYHLHIQCKTNQYLNKRKNRIQCPCIQYTFKKRMDSENTWTLAQSPFQSSKTIDHQQHQIQETEQG